MKVDLKKVAIFLVIIVDCLIGLVIFSETFDKDKVEAKMLDNELLVNQSNELLKQTVETSDKKLKEEIRKASIVFDNMTIEELSAKLEKSMNSSLKGKGELFATYSIQLGLDPYLALAIVLQETGCSYNCSSLVKTNNNIGGLKGPNGYMHFNTLDEGIRGYLNILYKNYYSKGLTTPELMNPSYAASKTWAKKVNWYIDKIKAK